MIDAETQGDALGYAIPARWAEATSLQIIACTTLNFALQPHVEVKTSALALPMWRTEASLIATGSSEPVSIKR
jgi:hypothetical protein